MGAGPAGSQYHGRIIPSKFGHNPSDVVVPIHAGPFPALVTLAFRLW